MKKAKLVILTLVVLVLAIPSTMFAADEDVCEGMEVVTLGWDGLATLSDIFQNYDDDAYVQAHYGRSFLTGNGTEYCFVVEHSGDMPLNIGSQLTLTKLDNKDVHIVGLKINSMMNEAPLKIIHNGDSAKVFVRGLEITNANEGLSLMGAPGTLPPAGAIQIIDSTITGSAKEGNGITVASPGTILNNVTVSNCNEGVQVNSNDVQITDSRIFANKIGVHVMGGVANTDLNRSLIYANNDEDSETLARFDGVRMEGVISDLRFFEVIDDEPVFFEADTETVTFDNEQHMARILLPEDHGYDGRVEVYLADEDECGIVREALGQPCKIVEDLSTDISYEILAEGEGVQTALPASHMDKELVAVYTSTEKGSTAISQKFKVTSGEAGALVVVAFVQTPYDIPTPGGGATDSAELGSGSDDDGSDVIGGSGMDAGGLGASGMKCSLVESPMPSAMAFGLELWWIIFGIALLGSTRLATSRIRK